MYGQALVITDLAEVSALSKAGGTTENVVVVTGSLIKLFRTAFSFLGFGTLAMIGLVRYRRPLYRSAVSAGGADVSGRFAHTTRTLPNNASRTSAQVRNPTRQTHTK